MSDLETVDRCDLCGESALEDLHPSVRTVRCPQCSHVFHSPRPPLAAIREFYSRHGAYDGWLRELDARRGPWGWRAALVRRFRARGRLLDVGAGIGEFLAYVRSDFEITGTELSAEAVRIARERFGIALLEGDLGSLSLTNQRFDVITMFHVLEHLASPVTALRRCFDLLEPGGLLVVAVPNEGAAGWYKACHGGPRTLATLVARGPGFFRKLDLRNLPPHEAVDLAASPQEANLHLHHFNPESLARVLEATGFRVRYSGLDPHVVAVGLRWLRYRFRVVWFQLAYWITGILAYETMILVAERRTSR